MNAANAGAVGTAADFIRVSDAQRRYFGGRMSLRWWYRQVELGTLPHFRAGGAVLLRPSDVEAFIARGFRATPADAPAAEPPTAPAPPPASRPAPGGLRFFRG